jgi:hypothetical protein
MQSKPGSTNTREKVNQGLSGAPKGKPYGDHGQDSTSGGEHDSLVSIGANQTNPYNAKASDFPAGHAVEAVHGQSSGAEKLNSETAEKDTLAMQGENQIGPGYLEDEGPGASGAGTPSGWNVGGRAGKIASAFPVQANRGEAVASGTETALAEGVDLQTGKVTSKGYGATRVGEVPEDKVSIPGRG